VADDAVVGPRPDWRDAASYEYTRDLTEEGWAWEFLRRNPKYARAWREHGSAAAATHDSGNVRVLAQAAPSKEAAAWGLLTFRRSEPQRPRRRRALAS